MENPTNLTNRRSFIKRSGATLAGGVAAPSILIPTASAAEDNKQLKVGIVGCGGRGTGAAHQALTANPNNIFWAAADVNPKKVEGTLNGLRKKFPNQVDVSPSRQFVGLDAYQKVLDSGVDVVLLTTPPGFRPVQFEAAVKAGKHVFCEKPVAVDAAGIRKVLAAAEEAKRKNLKVQTGFCWRYHYERRAAFKNLHEGMIGDVTSMHATYQTGVVKPMPPASQRDPAMSDVEWQVRNWYNFGWLSGGSMVEQGIHSADKILWAFKDEAPVSCFGNGGRAVPSPGGNIFDHYSVCYQWKDGRQAFLNTRQINGCAGENADYIFGTKGKMFIGRGPVRLEVTGGDTWRYGRKDPNPNMYQVEHDELFAAIRGDTEKMDGTWMANSTMMGIMGRMAIHTGQRVSWDQAMKSQEDFAPEETLKWGDSFDAGTWPVPGKTKLV